MTTQTLAGKTMYVFSAIEHASRRIHILGVTEHPTTDWTIQMARNLLMDLDDAATRVKYLIHDYGSQFTDAFRARKQTRLGGILNEYERAA